MKRFVLGIMAFLVVAASAHMAFAGDMDSLVNKLVGKGVISKDDADSILAQSKNSGDEKLPGWIRKLTVSGDLRLRYEYVGVQGQSIGPINRGRFRYRLNLADQVADNVKAVFGISSDGGHSRSRNVTFGNTFSGKPMVINLAYAQYTPFKTLTVAGGKFPNPIWTPSMLTWDFNITPEGVFAVFTPPASGNLGAFVNADFFILDQLVNKPQFGAAMPYMFALQPGVDWKFNENGKVRVAAAYYLFDNLKRTYQFSNNLPGTIAQGGLSGPIGKIFGPAGTNNTLDAKKDLVYNYNDLWLGAQADFNKLSGVLPYAGLYGEYIYNPSPSSNNKGYIAGVKLGHASTAGRGLWQIDYSYRRLERDAWLDILPDADFFYGSTNVLGSRTSLTCGLAKNIYTAITWYNTRQISPNTAAGQTATHKMNTIQVDLGMSF
ncbi:MAG: putative porin [Nitrospiraceae bacterium]|nr:putative porin [Nitrospiraceae bacterium]